MKMINLDIESLVLDMYYNEFIDDENYEELDKIGMSAIISRVEEDINNMICNSIKNNMETILKK